MQTDDYKCQLKKQDKYFKSLREFLATFTKKKIESMDIDEYVTGKKNKKSTIIMLEDLVGIHKISTEEYCSGHAIGKWEGMIFQVEDMNATYYDYDFINPKRLAVPIKIEKNGRAWTTIQDSVQQQFIFQERLF